MDNIRRAPHFADLVRVIHPFPTTLEVGFLKASSYGSSSTTSGEVKIDSGFNLKSVTGKDVLVVSCLRPASRCFVGVWYRVNDINSHGNPEPNQISRLTQSWVPDS